MGMRPSDAVAALQRLIADDPDRSAADRRVIVGLVGPPGVGKSTVADAILDALGDVAVLLPMDGFHLSNAVLTERGLLDRKGAPHTFDVAGYVTTLTRIRADRPESVFAPRFHREIEESIAAEIEIAPTHRVVVTEGNYLLLDDGGWGCVRELLDVAWYLDLDDAVRVERLVARHVRYGKDPAAAREWALGTDQRNAELVAATAPLADDHIELT